MHTHLQSTQIGSFRVDVAPRIPYLEYDTDCSVAVRIPSCQTAVVASHQHMSAYPCRHGASYHSRTSYSTHPTVSRLRTITPGHAVSHASNTPTTPFRNPCLNISTFCRRKERPSSFPSFSLYQLEDLLSFLIFTLLIVPYPLNRPPKVFCANKANQRKCTSPS